MFSAIYRLIGEKDEAAIELISLERVKPT